MSLSEKVQQINREISATVERALSDLRQEVSQRLRSSHEEVLRRLDEITPELPGAFFADEDIHPAAEQMAEQRATAASAAAAATAGAVARHGAFVEVRDALAAIDRARSQAEILAALLRESSRFASRAAVLLLRGSELRGWGGQGFGEAEPAIRELSLAASDGSAWGRLAQAQAAERLSATECAELCSRIEAPLPHDGAVVPLVLRDRVAAALYVDRLDGDLAIEALQVLCYVAAQSIELLPFRERPTTPTLTLEGGSTAAPPVPETGGGAAPAPSAEATASEPAPAPEPEEAGSELSSGQEGRPAWQPAAEVEAEPEPVPEPVAEPWTTTAEPEPAFEAEVEAEAETVSDVEAMPEELPQEPSPAWSAPAPAPASPPASPAATVYQPLPPEIRIAPAAPPEPAFAAAGAASDATVLLPRPGLQPVPAPPPLRSVPPPAPAPEASEAAPSSSASLAGSPEVKPPSDVEGPGWAFATGRVAVSPSDEALHEEARRLARLLVSEIKLYNEEQVEEGRRKRDVYERLKEDIDRSRQMYEERVEPRILKTTDYFYQELVRILAAGDAKALGI
jgi:hypothetical protein